MSKRTIETQELPGGKILLKEDTLSDGSKVYSVDLVTDEGDDVITLDAETEDHALRIFTTIVELGILEIS